MMSEQTIVPTNELVIETIKTIIDPELFIDIWTLGLIYGFEIVDGIIDVQMTFTSVACPAGPELAHEVKTKLEVLEGITEAKIDIVFTPPWQPSEELKALMGIG